MHIAGIARLSLSSTSNGILIFNNSGNANTVSIQSGTTTASHTLILPAAQGAAGTYLKNDGAGNLSWQAPSSVTEVTSASAITTTGTTDVLATGMTVTPGAGNYIVMCSGMFSNSFKLGITYISIYVNGVKIASSERNQDGASGNIPFATQTYVSLLAGQAIEIRWRVNGNTGTLAERSLIVQKIN